MAEFLGPVLLLAAAAGIIIAGMWGLAYVLVGIQRGYWAIRLGLRKLQYCNAKDPSGIFECTRSPRHEGEHRAEGPDGEVYERWPR